MPARFRKVVKAAKGYGFELSEKKGRHVYKLKREGDRAFPITAHNGLKSEISDVYINAFCDQYGIDREEFRKKL